MACLSRLRVLLLTLLVLALAAPALAQRRQAYLGGYTPDPADATQSGNRGEGIYLAEVDGRTGKISNVRLVDRSLSPSWLTLSKDGRFLYAVDEIATFGPNKSGSVSAYAIRPDGGLTLLNVVDSGGAIPCYISIDPSGRFALIANYLGGSFAIYRREPDGRLGEMTDLIRPDGPGASTTAPGASRGHMIDFDPSGRFVIGDDAGRNQIFVWILDGQTGKLKPISDIRTAPHTAPRHFVFSADGKTMYQLMEQSSELGVFVFSDGQLTQKRDNLSALPEGWAGSNTGSELLISPDGKRLYFANRLHDTIAVFAIGLGGDVRRIANVHTQGDLPRSLTLDPAGRFLYSLNQRGNNVTTYRIGADGVPAFTGEFLRLGTPAVMVFAK